MQDVPPRGAVVIHQFYPGFMDLPAFTQYLVIDDELEGAVQVLSHARPLVVTDFDNGFVRTSTGDQVFTRLRKPVSDVHDDSLVLDARGHEGRSAPTIVVEKSKLGRIFYCDMYTELQTCWEFWRDEDTHNLTNHGLLVERFVGAYRFTNPDVRFAIAGDVPLETTPLRIGYYYYSPAEQALPFDQRIVEAWPQDLQISIMGTGRGAAALRDHAGDEKAVMKRGENVNAYLCNGFKLSENQWEIERLADLAFSQKRPRAAIIEAMSILEVALMQARDRLSSTQRRSHVLRKPHEEITMRFLVEKVLPALLSHYDGDIGDVVKAAIDARRIRNQCVHHGHQPTPEEANKVLSAVRTVLTIFETPDAFKGNYKLRGLATNP